MRYENAQQSVLNYVASDLGRDLDDAQVEKLTQYLARTQRVEVIMLPEAVEPHVVDLFGDAEDEVPSRQPQKQTRAEALQVLADFFNSGEWEKVAPGTIPGIVSHDGVTKIASMINHRAFVQAVDAHVSKGGLVRRDHLSGILLDLFLSGALERSPQTVEPAPPPPPPSARDLHNAQVKRDKAMNDASTSPIKGAKSKPAPLVDDHKPTLTEEQKQAANEKAARDNAIVQEALSRINTYAGSSHSRTYSGRAALREAFQEAMDSVKTAEEVLAAVDARANQLAGNSSIR